MPNTLALFTHLSEKFQNIDYKNEKISLSNMTLSDLNSFAQRLTHSLTPGTWIFLSGDLGAGKTTFSRFLLSSLNASPIDVSSPTFPILNSIPLPESTTLIKKILHLDLYRIRRDEEILYLGLENEFIPSSTLALIEWPEMILEEFWEIFFTLTNCKRPNEILKITLENLESPDLRKVSIEFMELRKIKDI